ncbi:MAG: hypothetical protein ACO294_08230 [Methylococcales bacterium]
MDTKELIDQMITDILAGNNVEARDSFDQAIGLKVTGALDTAKVEVAQAIYARDAEEEVEENEIEVEDEDVSETEE